MKSDLIDADAVLDRLPIHTTLEAVDDLVSEVADTVPDIVSAGASKGRRTVRHISKASSRLSRPGWLMVGAAAAVLITLVLWRWRTADGSSESSADDRSTSERPRRIA